MQLPESKSSNTFDSPPLKLILEAALVAAGEPLSLERLQTLFEDDQQPNRSDLKIALRELQDDLTQRGIELVEVASGYRLQVREQFAPWVARLWEEKPQRYSRALLETLALIAYRQPITRGDIEDVRGVVVSSQMIKTLLEREWVRVVGHRDVPGRPALYATTKTFLDYFGLKNLEDLPSLMAIRELDDANRSLPLDEEEEKRQSIADQAVSQADDEDVSERGKQILDSTQDDLAKAAALVDRVESNLFKQTDDEDVQASEPSKTSSAISSTTPLTTSSTTTTQHKDMSDVLQRFENASDTQDPSEQDS